MSQGPQILGSLNPYTQLDSLVTESELPMLLTRDIKKRRPAIDELSRKTGMSEILIDLWIVRKRAERQDSSFLAHYNLAKSYSVRKKGMDLSENYETESWKSLISGSAESNNLARMYNVSKKGVDYSSRHANVVNLKTRETQVIGSSPLKYNSFTFPMHESKSTNLRGIVVKEEDFSENHETESRKSLNSGSAVPKIKIEETVAVKAEDLNIQQSSLKLGSCTKSKDTDYSTYDKQQDRRSMNSGSSTTNKKVSVHNTDQHREYRKSINSDGTMTVSPAAEIVLNQFFARNENPTNTAMQQLAMDLEEDFMSVKLWYISKKKKSSNQEIVPAYAKDSIKRFLINLKIAGGENREEVEVKKNGNLKPISEKNRIKPNNSSGLYDVSTPPLRPDKSGLEQDQTCSYDQSDPLQPFWSGSYNLYDATESIHSSSSDVSETSEADKPSFYNHNIDNNVSDPLPSFLSGSCHSVPTQESSVSSSCDFSEESFADEVRSPCEQLESNKRSFHNLKIKKVGKGYKVNILNNRHGEKRVGLHLKEKIDKFLGKSGNIFKKKRSVNLNRCIMKNFKLKECFVKLVRCDGNKLKPKKLYISFNTRNLLAKCKPCSVRCNTGGMKWQPDQIESLNLSDQENSGIPNKEIVESGNSSAVGKDYTDFEEFETCKENPSVNLPGRNIDKDCYSNSSSSHTENQWSTFNVENNGQYLNIQYFDNDKIEAPNPLLVENENMCLVTAPSDTGSLKQEPMINPDSHDVREPVKLGSLHFGLEPVNSNALIPKTEPMSLKQQTVSETYGGQKVIEPVSSTGTSVLQIHLKPRSTKRGKGILVDWEKDISSERMKIQFSNTSDIIRTFNLAPPTKKHMHWKKNGRVEKLFVSPGRLLSSKRVLKLFKANLITSQQTPEGCAPPDVAETERQTAGEESTLEIFSTDQLQSQDSVTFKKPSECKTSLKPTKRTQPNKPWTPLKLTERTQRTEGSTLLKPTERPQAPERKTPLKLTERTQPTESWTQLKLTERTQPTERSTSLKPTERTQPTKPWTPLKPTECTQTTERSTSLKPTERTQPTKPWTPLKLTERTQPTKPWTQLKLTERTQPTERSTSLKPTERTQPTKPWTPLKLTERTQPTERSTSLKPTERTQPTERSTSLKPTKLPEAPERSIPLRTTERTHSPQHLPTPKNEQKEHSSRYDLSENQVDKLQQMFTKNSNPSLYELEMFSTLLDVKIGFVLQWFYEKREEKRKMARKLSTVTTEDSGSDSHNCDSTTF